MIYLLYCILCIHCNVFPFIVVNQDSGQEAVEEAAAFLFETFKDTEKVTSVESTLLRKTFGPYSATLATNAFEAVQEFISLLPPEFLEEENSKSSTTGDHSVVSKRYFGHKLKFGIDFEEKKFDELYSDFSDKNEQTIQADNFVELFRDKLNINNSGKQNGDVASSENAYAGEQDPSNGNIASTQSKFSPSWLLKQCEQHIKEQGNASGLNAGDLRNAVFDVINSTKSNDEIQNELFDLLGFEAFDLIQLVLQHRTDIIQAHIKQEKQMSALGSEYQYIDPLRKHNKPIPGQQVTIQSEQEKALLRKMQKEERKLMRKDPELYNELFNANRELDVIVTQPLFKKATISTTQKYPFVFDEFASRKHQSAFIGGTKILLPEQARKTVYPKYEEVDIPATATKPPEHLNIFVNIESLDDVRMLVSSDKTF